MSRCKHTFINVSEMPIHLANAIFTVIYLFLQKVVYFKCKSGGGSFFSFWINYMELNLCHLI